MHATPLIPSRNYFNTKCIFTTAVSKSRKGSGGVIISNKCNQLVKYLMTIYRFRIKMAAQAVGWNGNGKAAIVIAAFFRKIGKLWK